MHHFVLFLLCCLALPARAGLGPQNVAVVVNSASPASLAIANEYVDARRIPPGNVIYLDLPAEFVEVITVADFRRLILLPVLEQIRDRGLAGQIECVTYSADFPHSVRVHQDIGQQKLPAVITPIASISGLTYLYVQALRGDVGYLALNANRYAPPVHRATLATQQATSTTATPATRPVTMAPPRGFRRTNGWTLDGSPIADRPDRGYLLSTVLGVTRWHGNTVDEVRRMIRRSAAADGTAPRGTVYYMTNDDARSRARQWGFRAAVDQLRKFGVAAEIAEGVLPQRKQDVAGLMVWATEFDWAKSGSTILPGAICEHLTSTGGVMPGKGGGQMPLSAFVRAGAAGTSGTVTEPYAIQEKFPSPFVHVYYAAGCTLAEAFYQSVSGPYQLLVVGDPLCRPWGKAPALEVGVAPGATLRGAVTLRPAIRSEGFEPARFELFIDGKRQATTGPGKDLPLDTTTLPDGYHELRLVAVGKDAIESQGEVVVPVTVDNRGRAVSVTPPAGLKIDAPTGLAASMKGARRLLLTHNGRTIATHDGDAGTLKVDPAIVGSGPVTLFVVGVDGPDGGERWTVSAPVRVGVTVK
jgi:hypothetical protein